jgi:hypothetical protein
MCWQVLDRFLQAKAKVDGGAEASQEEQENQCIDALHALTSLRALMAYGLQSGECATMILFHMAWCFCQVHVIACCPDVKLQSALHHGEICMY